MFFFIDLHIYTVIFLVHENQIRRLDHLEKNDLGLEAIR